MRVTITLSDEQADIPVGGSDLAVWISSDPDFPQDGDDPSDPPAPLAAAIEMLSYLSSLTASTQLVRVARGEATG